MEIEYYVVERDNKKEIAVDPSTVVGFMENAERFAGAYSAERIADHWYALKQHLTKIAITPIPAEESKPGKKKK